MPSLAQELRRQLEKTVVAARNAAEAGAAAALTAAGIGDPKPPAHLDPAGRQLRERLRAHGRQAGDVRSPDGNQSVAHLIQECAYEHWHRMLFARFLAENDLLRHPEHDVAMSLDEIADLAREENTDPWELASRFAQGMLPQIFRPDDPVLQLRLPGETRNRLVALLKELPRETFLADDSLGWVYQFWQNQRKEEVNKSGSKIGADELSPVTQLFTEDYMVDFLLDNTLGAWWAGKVLAKDGDGGENGALPQTPPGRHDSPDPSLQVWRDVPAAEPAGASRQTAGDASRLDAAALVTEQDMRRMMALPGVEWNYLRFVTDPRTADPATSPAASDATADATGASAAAEDRSRQQQDEGSGESGRPGGGSGAAPPSSWRPAAGTFSGWPKSARELKCLDPCMGSGHFIVAMFGRLVALRMAEEGLDEKAAVAAVIRDNLFGLEIDPRCTQLAAFNLALAAWRRVGYYPLPPMNLACSGLSINAHKDDWLKLAESAAAGSLLAPKRDLFGSEENLLTSRLREGMSRLYDLFQQAPILGSLINPRQVIGGGDLFTAEFHDLAPLLEAALARETGDDAREMAVTAKGLAKTAEILAGQFTLVATNVPYLGRGKQDDVLLDYCERIHSDAKADLATCFVERCLGFCTRGGSTVVVTPQNWWFHSSSRGLRASLLSNQTMRFLATLGEEAWQTFGNRGPLAVLMVIDNAQASDSHAMFGVDALPCATIPEKSAALYTGELVRLTQAGHFKNPDHRITIREGTLGPLLEEFAGSYLGLGTCDAPHYTRRFWEIPTLTESWSCLQAGPSDGSSQGGREQIVAWDKATRRVLGMSDEERRQGHNQDYRGSSAWGRRGVAVSLMRTLRTASYDGDLFEKSIAVLVPKRANTLLAIKAFTESPEYFEAVRRIDNKVMVTNATLAKVPFDLAHWQQVAAEKYPDGLPKPHSDDPTQWIFHGHPNPGHPHGMLNRPPDSSLDPRPSTLQVAVARLLGYQWPRQTGSSFPDCPALGPDGLEALADTDGIVPLTSLRGEEPAAERLRKLLAVAFGTAWKGDTELELIRATGSTAPTLEDWLRDDFFAQHCALFHHRPFLWHIWDGRKDGFHALVNYHRLAAPDGGGKRALEALTYVYLGDWLTRQKDAIARNEPGAEARLAAAQELQAELKKILAGEPPYDLFIRWKPLARQPIGWEPDINDGVRLNIRPFMLATLSGGKRGAGLLRAKPNIKWDKDRGKEPERPRAEFPWFWDYDAESPQLDFSGTATFDGNRWNDCHYTSAFKRDMTKPPRSA